MNKIIGITVDKQLADNLPKDLSIVGDKIPDNQSIQVTATVMNDNDDVQSGVIVYFRMSVNLSYICILDENKRAIQPDSNVFTVTTNDDGEAIIYIASSDKIITHLTATLIISEEDESPNDEQTLVFCTFDDSGTLDIAELTLDQHGRVHIEPDVYSVEASSTQVIPGPNYWCATWLYGKTDGYLDDDIKGRIIDAFSITQNNSVSFNVPCQWMDTRHGHRNQLAYLLYEVNGEGRLSKKWSFLATGVATAMPDINGLVNKDSVSTGYCEVGYLYSESKGLLLTDDDLNAHDDNLAFYIPSYPGLIRAIDKLEINIYLSGWDSEGVNVRNKQIQKKMRFKDLSRRSGKHVFYISKQDVAGFGSSYEGEPGKMFIQYQVNGRYLSKPYQIDINFEDISLREI
ncbi:hypothetical protein [Photorhabdus viridis]|uniref:hypothetical protein n=1 Tax=Photorhabdus viridis TaxID=3163327 RepID=UPI003306E0DF